MQWLRRVIAFILAVATSVALASLSSTHFVLGALADLDVNIGFADRLYAYGHDLLGMGGLFGTIVALGFFIAFPVAALPARFWPASRTACYVAAGATAIMVALLAMQAVFGIMPIAGARSWAGLVGQGAAGAVGGLVFAVVAQRVTQGSAARKTEGQ